MARVSARTAKPQALTVGQDGGATPCAAAIAGAGYTAPQLAQGYNFNGLYKKGLLGHGATLLRLRNVVHNARKRANVRRRLELIIRIRHFLRRLDPIKGFYRHL